MDTCEIMRWPINTNHFFYRGHTWINFNHSSELINYFFLFKMVNNSDTFAHHKRETHFYTM